MIKLTRINGNEFVLNVDYIKFIEQTPDTIITLRDGDKVLVKEDIDDVVKHAIEYHRHVRIFESLE